MFRRDIYLLNKRFIIKNDWNHEPCREKSLKKKKKDFKGYLLNSHLRVLEGGKRNIWPVTSPVTRNTESKEIL